MLSSYFNGPKKEKPRPIPKKKPQVRNVELDKIFESVKSLVDEELENSHKEFQKRLTNMHDLINQEYKLRVIKAPAYIARRFRQFDDIQYISNKCIMLRKDTKKEEEALIEQIHEKPPKEEIDIPQEPETNFQVFDQTDESDSASYDNSQENNNEILFGFDND